MGEIASIRQNANMTALPDFGSLAVWLQIILGAHFCALLGLMLFNQEFNRLPADFFALILRLEPILFLSLGFCYFCRRLLRRMPYAYSAGLFVAIGILLSVLTESVVAEVLRQTVEAGRYARIALWAAVTASCLLCHFHYRFRLRGPAFSDARLMALTARIRPHFLFNSLNAVLGVIRSDPRRAEAALEELADLFRALMRENRELTPLSEEIALARQYVDLERLRLGERLRVVWDVDSCPPDSLVPPLMLQPLLENAVYHGIEPSPLPGAIRIRLGRHDNRIRIEVSNPLVARSGHARGSQIALANIRERLELFFGMDAILSAGARAESYHVIIDIPFAGSRGAT